MKKIALFSDGTGNSASSANKTNVWRAYKALDLSPGSGQVGYYDNGVGTSAFRPVAILGLAFGFGLARNVRQIYNFLCHTYEPGDQIYCFGFSRGAFTIRVLAALVASEGIINHHGKSEQEMRRLVNAAYRNYRHKNFTPSLLSVFLRPMRDWLIGLWWKLCSKPPYDPGQNLRHTPQADEEPLIRFIGVWDTVDAYGFPIDEFTRAWDMVVWPLNAKDRDLSPRVARACHALALDEQRKSFEPMLWNEFGMPRQKELRDERLTQVWFAGVHANVGGGYPDDSLSLVSLDWMLQQCEQNHSRDDGLRFMADERERIGQKACFDGPLYDSRSGIGNLYRYDPRDIDRLCRENKPGLANWLKSKIRYSRWYIDLAPKRLRELMERFTQLQAIHDNPVVIERPKIHHSVFKRLRRDGQGYAPINIPDNYAYVDAEGNLIDIRRPRDRGDELPESRAEAEARKQEQRYVWNKVWARKLLYTATLVSIISFIAYPYFGGKWEDLIAGFLQPLLGTVGSLIEEIPLLVGKIPGLGFAEDWIIQYKSLPYAFILGVLFILGLLWLSAYVKRLINTQMRGLWTHLTQTWQQKNYSSYPFIEKAKQRLRERMTHLLGGRRQTDRFRGISGVVLEGLAVGVLLSLVVIAASKLHYTVADAFGFICDETPALQNQALDKAFVFNPKNACFNTGLELEKGKTYAIQMELKNWTDASIAADAKGWCQDWCDKGHCLAEPSWWLYLATPLRRHLFADWYQPMARIGHTMLDRYSLTMQKPDPGKRQMTLTTDIKARRNGRLYLYLNDAVLFTPDLMGFYENNKGCATVKVTEVSPMP